MKNFLNALVFGIISIAIKAPVLAAEILIILGAILYAYSESES